MYMLVICLTFSLKSFRDYNVYDPFNVKYLMHAAWKR